MQEHFAGQDWRAQSTQGTGLSVTGGNGPLSLEFVVRVAPVKGNPGSVVPHCALHRGEPFMPLLAEPRPYTTCWSAVLMLPALRNSLAEVNVKKSKIALPK